MSLVSEALERATSQFQASPKVLALLEAIVGPLDDVKATTDEFKTERWIDTAIGSQLDGCGYIVGELRGGRDDDDYRAAIKFRVFINVSEGTPSDLQKALAFLVGGDDKQYLEMYPATALMFSDGVTGKYTEKLERASTATYVDAGVLKYAAVNEPRYQNGVLMVEAAGTNLFSHSAASSVTGWGIGSNLTRVSSATAPDGSGNASIYATSSTGNAYIVQACNISANTTYTMSVFARLRAGAAPSDGALIVVDRDSNGDAGSYERSILPFSELVLDATWRRYQLTFANVAAVNSQLFLCTDFANGAQIDIWGAQLETGPVATSYIPTTSAPATRAADRIFYELSTTGFTDIQKQIQDLAPAGISDVPVLVSYTEKPFRFSKELPLGELFVNGKTSYLTANGSDITVSNTSIVSNGPTFGGIAPAELTAGTQLIDVNGSILVINSVNHQTIIESGYHLTGVF